MCTYASRLQGKRVYNKHFLKKNETRQRFVMKFLCVRTKSVHVPKFCNLNLSQKLHLSFHRSAIRIYQNDVTIKQTNLDESAGSSSQHNNKHSRAETETFTEVYLLAVAVCTGLDSHHARIMLIRWTRHQINHINKAFTGTPNREDASLMYD